MGVHIPKFKIGFNRETARAIIEHLLNKHGIAVTKRSENKTGYAHIGTRSVQIPYPNTVENFMVCMHEIGHIVCGSSNRMSVAEFKAEKYALKMGHKCGLTEEAMARYRLRARRYILSCVHKGHIHHLKLDRLPQDLVDFVGYDFSQWAGLSVLIKKGSGKIHIYIIDKEGRKTASVFQPS